MPSVRSLPGIATMLLFAPLAACIQQPLSVTADVPHCEALIPAMLLEAVESAPIPEARQLPDGHDDAQPWQVGWIEQTGQLEKSNPRAPAVDHIYRTCLDQHRQALQRSTRRRFLGL